MSWNNRHKCLNSYVYTIITCNLKLAIVIINLLQPPCDVTAQFLFLGISNLGFNAILTIITNPCRPTIAIVCDIRGIELVYGTIFYEFQDSAIRYGGSFPISESAPILAGENISWFFSLFRRHRWP
jgi:hypothetical protein